MGMLGITSECDVLVRFCTAVQVQPFPSNQGAGQEVFTRFPKRFLLFTTNVLLMLLLCTYEVNYSCG